MAAQGYPPGGVTSGQCWDALVKFLRCGRKCVPFQRRTITHNATQRNEAMPLIFALLLAPLIRQGVVGMQALVDLVVEWNVLGGEACFDLARQGSLDFS